MISNLQGKVLINIYNEPNLTTTYYSHKTMSTYSFTQKLIKRMISLNLVKYIKSDNHRNRPICLTSEGESLVKLILLIQHKLKNDEKEK